MEHLCVRSVERKLSSKSKIYFQLNVSSTQVLNLPNELVDFYGFNSWLVTAKEEHKLIIFHNDENKKALKLNLINDDKINYSNGDSKFIISEINIRFEQEELVTHSEIENLFNECLIGKVMPGHLLYGAIAKRSVLPYEFDKKIVSSHTRPVLWPKELSDEEKGKYVKSVFAKIGRVVIDSESSLTDKLSYMRANDRQAEYQDKYNESSQYDEYGGPSDGYGGYLEDDFINDAFGGDEDAYWNID